MPNTNLTTGFGVALREDLEQVRTAAAEARGALSALDRQQRAILKQGGQVDAAIMDRQRRLAAQLDSLDVRRSTLKGQLEIEGEKAKAREKSLRGRYARDRQDRGRFGISGFGRNDIRNLGDIRDLARGDLSLMNMRGALEMGALGARAMQSATWLGHMETGIMALGHLGVAYMAVRGAAEGVDWATGIGETMTKIKQGERFSRPWYGRMFREGSQTRNYFRRKELQQALASQVARDRAVTNDAGETVGYESIMLPAPMAAEVGRREVWAQKRISAIMTAGAQHRDYQARLIGRALGRPVNNDSQSLADGLLAIVGESDRFVGRARLDIIEESLGRLHVATQRPETREARLAEAQKKRTAEIQSRRLHDEMSRSRQTWCARD